MPPANADWILAKLDPNVPQHGQSAPLAVPQLGSCASSGRLTALAGSALSRERLPQWEPSHGLGCSSLPPPKPPKSPPLAM